MAEDSELKFWKRRLILAWIFTIPLSVLMLFGKITGIMLFSKEVMTIIMLIVAFPVIFLIGFNTIKQGLRGFITFYFNMDSLIALGTIIAYLTGIFSLFGLTVDYSGVSAMIMAFFITGKFIEAKAKGRASQEIMKLLELGAKKARILKNKEEIEINIEDLKLGDILIVKPGEKVPTDGVITKGESSVDESMISGESIPVDKKIKDSVIGATINQDGILYVKVTKVGGDTFLAHIIELLEETQSTTIPIQQLADKITSIFVPTILIISLFTFLNWWYFSNLSSAIGVSVAVLVIACPCSLGLATPTALMVGSGMGAKNGILIRKGEAIQTMKEVKTIVFDKTGTITKGKPEVREVFGEKNVLEIAASLENLSEHPIAKAVVKKANLKKYKDVKKFKNLRGKGISGIIGKDSIVIGNVLLMNEEKIKLDKFNLKIENYQDNGYTVMVVAKNKKVIGVIGVADAVKEDSKEAIRLLKNYKTVMITGDNERTARAIAKEVGISEVIANVLPEDKSNKVKELQESGFVAFVGDGINDAPALKQANVGIAIGNGSDIAIEAGDIVLVKGSLVDVVKSINLSKATFSKIKQNLFWAFAYNSIAIPIAIAGLLNPVIAEIAMALSSITVVTNANLLRRKKL